jgi:hypothetical protein
MQSSVDLKIMGQPEVPKIEELAEELEFWRVFREVHQAKGIDIGKFYKDLAARVQSTFVAGFEREFKQICDAGCLPEGLGLLIAVLKFSPELQKAWTELVGHTDNREKKAMALESAAKTLDFVYRNILPSEDVDDVFRHQGWIPVPQLKSELERQANFVRFAERLSEKTETNSLVEFSKYLFTSYVKRMTGDFHDRPVSALIGAAIGPEDYSSTAHSQWRYRNYDRLDDHHSWIVRLAVAMSVVIAHST